MWHIGTIDNWWRGIRYARFGCKLWLISWWALWLEMSMCLCTYLLLGSFRVDSLWGGNCRSNRIHPKGWNNASLLPHPCFRVCQKLNHSMWSISFRFVRSYKSTKYMHHHCKQCMRPRRCAHTLFLALHKSWPHHQMYLVRGSSIGTLDNLLVMHC